MLSTDRQTNRQTNATKNVTSFAKEVISYLGYIMEYMISSNDKDDFAVQKECRAIYARGNNAAQKV